MPTFQFEAMDATGNEIKDVIEAASEEEAQATIKEMGYFVTKISLKKARAAAAKKKGGKGGKTFALGGVKSKTLTTFTRQLSILQDAGLPILRSLRILENQSKPGALKNCLIDVCDEIEGGATLSEAMAKSPKAFSRLYVNMIKAGEAGGALEVILQRLADFQERSQSLKRKVKGALVYPVFVVLFAVLILVFIMLKIVPQFQKIFDDFGLDLPKITKVLIVMSKFTASYWWTLPAVPIGLWLFIKLVRKFYHGRYGFDLFLLKFPIFGQLVLKNIVARTMRTLGTLVASGVPILEALHITQETSGNAVFEKLYKRVHDAIREGETIATPMKENCRPGFHPVAMFFWALFIVGPIGVLMYLLRMNDKIVDDMVINMVDVGEETGELDTMLYKVADTFDEEVAVLTESLTSLMEPLLIIVLGTMIGFIVIALFMPLIDLISNLSGGKK
jgi:type IV pilus assembly protein PilC